MTVVLMESESTNELFKAQIGGKDGSKGEGRGILGVFLILLSTPRKRQGIRLIVTCFARLVDVQKGRLVDTHTHTPHG